MSVLSDKSVYSRAQVRELDRIAIEQYGIAGYELMSRAGQAALNELQSRWPGAQELLIYCGAGNNAGDGYVLARLAQLRGLTVRIAAVVAPERLSGDAAQAWQECREAGVPIGGFDAASADDGVPDVVVDALLGTGLDRDLGGDMAAAVATINRHVQPVVALDIPSGLDADTGLPLGTAVTAALTVTFVGLKQGLFLGRAPDYCGEIVYSDLGLPAQAADALAPVMQRLTDADLGAVLPRRPRTAHKGANGRLLLVGGAAGMGGAIRLAGEAALRTGAGLVYVATHPDSVATVMAGRPELMCRRVEAPAELDALIELADAVVLGPGLGRSDWARALFERIIGVDQPLIADADALNLIAEAPEPPRRERWVVTPHPGEAGRLLGADAGAIQTDRLGSVRALAERYGATVILKGACTLVAARDASGELAVSVCDRGNPGMASGGMGDLLSGIVGALLVQGAAPADAARAAVLLHALAGDDAAADGERGMIASDLLPHIRRRANPN